MKLPLMIGGGVLLTLLLMNGCNKNKQNTSSTTEHSATQVKPDTQQEKPDTESDSIAKITTSTSSVPDATKTSMSTQITASSQNNSDQTISKSTFDGEEIPFITNIASTEIKPDFSDNQTLASAEAQIDKGITSASNANDRADYEGALEDLLTLVNQTNFKSAKARYFLARQYQMMDQNGFKSDTSQSYAEASRLHANAAAKLGSTNLDQYPSNKIYAEKSKNLLVQL